MSPGRTLVLAVGASLALAGGCRTGASVGPEASYSPSEVVRLQIEALAGADASDGIAVAFRFASPANREMTGPLERFERIVRAPNYRPMLDQVAALYGPVRIDGIYAAQVVTIVARDGARYSYLFELSRQSRAPYDGCWMTDSGVPLERQSGQGFEI